MPPFSAHPDIPSLHTAYLSFGSNLRSTAGAPAATITAGLRELCLALSCSRSEVVLSSLYRTAPVGYGDQPAFINGVACLKTLLSPVALLQKMLTIEQLFGRVRGRRYGPRTLDLDLLLVDDSVLSTSTLTLPHPRMAERRFVLAPLAEVAPAVIHPLLGLSIAELLKKLPATGEQGLDRVERLSDTIEIE